ncbi:MAG: MFS transporter [Actinomycetota bacterium]
MDGTTEGRWATRIGVAAVLASTTASVFPAFLTGAVGVQLRDELAFSERELGFGVGAFFLCAAIGSAPGGRLVQRLGATRAITAALALSAASMAAIAVLVDSFATLAICLGIAGFANAVSQPGANLYLSRTVHVGRLALAVSAKQAGMPTATLLGGLAVPLVALTVGWRWAYAIGASIALLAILALRIAPTVSAVAPIGERQDRPTTPLPVLGLAGFGMVFGAAAAGAIGAWVVSSAEASGIGSGASGLLLTYGSAVGIASRLYVGWRADGSARSPLATVSTMLVVGAGGIALLAADPPVVQVVAVTFAFGAGWAWPGLFNYAIVRANPAAAGAATGVTQIGTYIGAVLGPVVFGLIVDGGSYTVGWFAVAGWALVAATVMWTVSRRLLVAESAPLAS